MASSELDHEREYVGTLYRRLDELKADAVEKLANIRAEGGRSGHQARSERDSFARLYEDRILQLRQVDERLAFGRLTVEPDAGDLTHHYIGRLGMRDAGLVPILLDWRVPQASAFYQATAKTPMGAKARRHLISEGRTLLRIEDEIFDAELLGDAAFDVQGEGALLAALGAQRTGRMSDIVATIQAEQDRIIRSDLNGILVVQGGPGTGKTAVALHRAAYLLYSHRERLSNSGVLIVGPSKAFLRYIEAVLPSLGESGVVLASLGQLYPGVEATHEDVPRVATLKGSTEMAALLQRAVESRKRVPESAQPLNINGEIVILQPEVVARAIQRARESQKPYNKARTIFAKQAIASITSTLITQLREQGNSIDESDEAMLREDVRSSEDARVVLNTAWLPLTPQKLLQDLYARPQWLESLTPGWGATDRALLFRDRTAGFTVSDIPLLDEAAELLGEVEVQNAALLREQKLQRKRDVENAEQAIQNMGVSGIVSAQKLADGFADYADTGTLGERAATDRTWAYGHVVVDEAQELSPMQWRVLLRRAPSRSFTIVGDIAQAAAASASQTWHDALAPIIAKRVEGEGWRREELTVNYRTPAKIAAAAETMAIAHQLPVTRSMSVRDSAWPIETASDAASAVRLTLTDDGAVDGTVAVIAVEARLNAIRDDLIQEFGNRVGLGSVSLSCDITVLSALEAKGLEFDTVVIVDPAAIVAESERGASALYVAMTRPTQRLLFAEVRNSVRGLPLD